MAHICMNLTRSDSGILHGYAGKIGYTNYLDAIGVDLQIAGSRNRKIECPIGRIPGIYRNRLSIAAVGVGKGCAPEVI